MNKWAMYLVKIQFINQFRFNDLKKGAGTSKAKANAIMLAVAYSIVILVFGGYSYGLSYGLGYLGLQDLIPAYAVTLTGIVTMFLTMLKANGILFGYKDYDLLMSLPISTATVIASRFLYMYVMNMIFTMVVMLPMGVGYALLEKPPILGYIYWIVSMFVAPLIPTAIATIIGAIIMAISSRFKYSKVVYIVCSFILIIGILMISMMGGTMESSFSIENISSAGNYIYEQMCSIYPPAMLFSKAFNKGGIIYFLIFVVVSLGIYILFVNLLSLKYKKINSSIKGYITSANYKLTTLKESSPLGALYKKELRRFFSSSIYVLNVGTGIVMSLVFTIALAVMGAEKLEQTMGMPGFADILYKIIPYIPAVMIAMTCTTSSSLSLEGKNLWILKSAPIKTKTIFDSKILVNLTLVIPAAIINSILIVISLKLDIVNSVICFMIPITFGVLTAVWGMFINIKFPNFEWENEVTVIKQSMASIIGMLGGGLLAILAMGLLFVPVNIPYEIIDLLVVIILWIVIGILYKKISKSSID